MKKLNILFAILLTAIAFTSCKKEGDDAGIPPAIVFKTIAGYVSADMVVPKDTTVLIGITATRTEANDILKTFDASRGYDGAASVSFLNNALTSASANVYDYDMPIHVRNQAGTEKYTFTILNKDGLKNSVTLTLTVQ